MSNCEEKCDTETGSMSELLIFLIIPTVTGIGLIILGNKVFNYWGK